MINLGFAILILGLVITLGMMSDVSALHQHSVSFYPHQNSVSAELTDKPYNLQLKDSKAVSYIFDPFEVKHEKIVNYEQTNKSGNRR